MSKNLGQTIKMAIVVMLASIIAATLPARALAPTAGLHYLVGMWRCTYRAGAVRLAYDAKFAYDLDGHTLRQIASWKGGGDEEFLAYDAQIVKIQQSQSAAHR